VKDIIVFSIEFIACDCRRKMMDLHIFTKRIL